jgi:hypothetical protein
VKKKKPKKKLKSHQKFRNGLQAVYAAATQRERQTLGRLAYAMIHELSARDRIAAWNAFDGLCMKILIRNLVPEGDWRLTKVKIGKYPRFDEYRRLDRARLVFRETTKKWERA